MASNHATIYVTVEADTKACHWLRTIALLNDAAERYPWDDELKAVKALLTEVSLLEVDRCHGNKS